MRRSLLLLFPIMMVTRSAHEAALQSLADQLDRQGIPESAGIHGPQSMGWRVNAESANFLGAGCAVLMQLAHPYVAYGIAQHSLALADIHKRFVGTFESIYRMTFGDRRQAFASARQIFLVHTRIVGTLPEELGRFSQGHRYHANEVAALRWVHSTLVSTAMEVHTTGGLRLSPQELDEFYDQSKRFALLFGLRSTMLPETRRDFQRFVAEEVAGDSIGVSPPAREIGRFLLTAPSAALEPAFVVIRAVTAKLLGTRLSDAYGLAYGAKEAALATAVLRASGPLRRLSPAALRLVPDAIRAEARLGLRKPSRVSPWLESVLHRGLEAWPAG